MNELTLEKDWSYDFDDQSEGELDRLAAKEFLLRYSTKSIDKEIKLIGAHGWDLLSHFVNSIEQKESSSSSTFVDLNEFPEKFDTEEEISKSSQKDEVGELAGQFEKLQLKKKYLKVIHPYLDSMQHTGRLLRELASDLKNIATRLGRGSLVLELINELKDEKAILSQIESHIKKYDDHDNDSTVTFQYVDTIQNCYYMYLLSHGDIVSYEGFDDWKVVHRKGGPYTFNPQYLIERYDEKLCKHTRNPAQNSLKAKEKPKQFHLVLKAIK